MRIRSFMANASVSAIILAVMVIPVAADPQGVTLDFRYRVESVIDDAFNENALASTLRTRLGYHAPEFRGWRAYVEFEDSRVIGFSDYNSTANGKRGYPTIADPEDTELNQAYLERRLGESSLLRLGRQRINIANQRFFGAVGFRQLEQTFDAVSFNARTGDGEMQLVYIDQVNRVFGAHHPVESLARTDTRTAIVDYERVIEGVTVGAYAHFIELPDSTAASHRNAGIRAGTNLGAFDGRIEVARQDDFRDGAGVIGANYHRVDLGWKVGSFHLGVLREVLGGDGNYAFQTPFATLHAFNGAVDRFLVTPANGLVDQAAQLRGQSGEWTYGAAWHRFSADAGNATYGEEVNAHVAHPLGKRASVRFEIADYRAETFGTDTRKAWLTLHAKY